MSLLNNMSIKAKLVFVLLFSVIGLSIFAGLQSFNYYNKYNSMQKIETLTYLSEKISKLVHETQKERGMTAGYLGSKGQKFKDKLPIQRELSNNNFEEFKNFSAKIDFDSYPKIFKDNVDKTITTFEGLDEIRPKVNTLDISAGNAIAYYTNMNALILNNVKLIAKLSSDAKISRELLAYANFLYSKERAGIERAVGANTLGQQSFGVGMKTKLINLISAQNVYMNNFIDLANENAINFYKQTMVGKEIDEVNRIREKLISSSFSDTAEYWFSQISGKINKLKTVDAKLASMLIEDVGIIKNDVSNGLIATLVGSVLTLFFALFFGFVVSQKITKNLNDFTLGLERFFDFLNYKVKDVELLLNDSTDEFGQMTKKVNENIVKTKNNIIQDRTLVDETIEVSNRINKGYLDGQISTSSSNPALNELKDILNNTIHGLNLTFEDIRKVLDSYTNLDYRPLVEKNKREGIVEQLIDCINSLGESITDDLVKSKRNGITLQNSANTLRENVKDITSSSNEAAASLEETAAALEEITSTIISNSDNVTQMAKYAEKVTISASSGEELAMNTMTAMDEINTQVGSINEAITVIDQIAFQTNILSLNAAVEAATAGEAGKGFAVVAQEVRNLASRSAEAAKEIKSIVETATIKSQAGKSITQKMLHGYKELNQDIGKTLELISDVDSASKEQQVGIEQINDAVTQLDQQTQRNAAAALETNDIAISTQKLSESIIEKANKKEFRGKYDTDDRRDKILNLSYENEEKRRAETQIKDTCNTRFPKKTDISKNNLISERRAPLSRVDFKSVNKIIIEKKEDDKWESF